MESARRQTLWYLLRADTGDARRARQRLAVGTCLALFLAGLLAAIGMAVVVLALCLLFTGVLAAAAAVRAGRQHRDQLSSAARSFASNVHRGLARAGASAQRHAKRSSSVLAETAQRAGASAQQHAKRSRVFLAEAAQQAAAGVRQVQFSPPRPIDVQREALRLNAAGTNERRRGAYTDAVDLHTRALLLLRDVDNPHAVALTQNNLALALSHVGDDPDAISLFEQAAATLHTLGDNENEGKIMANLALAHRRHGRTLESADVLRLALTKLERHSSAYELVEAELRRAS
jgi:tetratricopeptide (TPR) repeat protein